MRLTATRRLAWFFALLIAFSADPMPTRARAGEPTPGEAAKVVAGDADATLQKALAAERQKKWATAAEIYDQADKLWPGRTEFRQRKDLCEIHLKLVRRYQDQSFRTVLLRLSPERAYELFDEMIERIDTHYVDAIPLEPLLRRGLDNMEVALRDPAFLDAHAKGVSPSQVAWLRKALRARRDALVVPDRFAARAEVEAACDLARSGLGLGATAVALEFACGACDALDDYTSCLTPDKLDDLYAMIDGNFVGLGVELKQDDQGLKLVGVIKNGPAWEAGLKIGDRITSIGGVSVMGQSLDEAAGRLQGNAATAVDLVVLRPDGTSRSLHLTRREVDVASVAQARIVEPTLGVAYVQLIGFQKSSAAELDAALASLRNQGMRYLVLDLRGNPGGLLNVAVEIAERFIDVGTIVSTNGRAQGQSQVYRASGRATWPRLPMCVLVDRESTSASEILAGALKDNRRAQVLGERSYGKGSVQSIFSLRTVPAGLKLTTAKFYSPTGRAYSEAGVEPDVVVRASAKPAGPADRGAASGDFGDPETDPVLSQAIAQARRGASASAGLR